MSLRQTHEEIARRAGAILSPELRAALDEMLQLLANSGMVAASLKPGDRIPDFELPNVEGELISSADLLARGPLVLSFFRGDWCPYCNAELQALQEALPEIESCNATLVAVTPDTREAALSPKRRHQLSYQVLSDVDNGLGLLFGVIFRMPQALREQYLKLGIDLGARHGNDAWFLPIPATYVIDRRGVVRHAELNTDFRRRMEPAEIVRRLKEIGPE
jgi:peroxiredoxin